MELELPAYYDYVSSLSFVYIDSEPTPEVWDYGKCLFLFIVGEEPVAVSFRGNKAVVDAKLDDAERYIKLKLNLDLVEVMSDGVRVARDLGFLRRYPHIEGFLPPKLGDPPRLMYSGLIKAIIL